MELLSLTRIKYRPDMAHRMDIFRLVDNRSGGFGQGRQAVTEGCLKMDQHSAALWLAAPLTILSGPAWLRRDSLLVVEHVNRDVSASDLECRRSVLNA
jgi:hypothetical protein